VFRRLPNGAPDPTFGIGGTAKVDFSPQRDGGSGMLLSPSGKIVVGGSTRINSVVFGGPVGLARLLTNGRPDNTFGRNGKSTFPLDPTGAAMVWATLQKDGKILTLNQLNAAGQGYMAVTRHLVAKGTAK